MVEAAGRPAQASSTALDASTRASWLTGGQPVSTEDFLKLLTLQLKYQNPLEPMKETEFVTQLAQFSELEATRTLQSTLSEALERQLAIQALAQGAALLGRRVVISRGGETVEGMVERIRVMEGMPRLVVRGTEFDLADVVEVR